MYEKIQLDIHLDFFYANFSFYFEAEVRVFYQSANFMLIPPTEVRGFNFFANFRHYYRREVRTTL